MRARRGAVQFGDVSSIIIAENLGMFEEFAFRYPSLKVFPCDEKIVFPITFPAAR
jgi:hypothetical protein